MVHKDEEPKVFVFCDFVLRTCAVSYMENLLRSHLEPINL